MSTEEYQNAVLDRLDRILAAVETMAKRPNENVAESGPKVSKQSEAIVWAMTTNTTSPSLIAAKFGVTTRTVHNWKQLKSLLDNLKQTSGGRGPVSGFRTAGGGVEAVDDDWG